MDVSVVIVNWNTKNLVCNCLKSIYEQTLESEFEIIVVDNASTDGSVDIIKNEFPQTIIIENTENLGYATANNHGIKKANGRYILILNSDTIFIEDTIKKMVKYADEHPQIAVVGCRMLYGDKTIQESSFLFPSILNLFLQITYLSQLFPKNRFFGRERMHWFDWNDFLDVDVITGCFMFVRHNAIKEIGGMDEQFFMYFEETDWCFRFKRKGWKIVFAPISKVIHLGGESSKKIANKLYLQLYSSMLLYFKKHKVRSTYIIACLLISLFFSLRIPYWLGLAIISKKRRQSSLLIVKNYITGAFKSLLGWKGLRIKN